MNIVKAKEVEGWNTSVSVLFGKSPKITIKCGKCGKVFARRFNLNEFPDPVTKCDICNTVNVVPARYG